jgi:pimeloyl-ACP methyl ester carboxylesterase
MQTTLKVGEASVDIEYNLAPQMVVFSHGFGVRRDGHGLFTDIAAALPEGWGYLLFGYDRFDEATQSQRLVSAAQRQEILETVIDWTRLQSGVQQVHLVGHSMGSLTVAALAPQNIGEIVLMAPPLRLGSRFVERFNKRPGILHEGHTWSIPRSDGTTSVVDDNDLADLVDVDPEGELVKLAMFRSYTIMIADSDEVLPDADYTELMVMPSISMQGIEQANHDFAGQARAATVQAVINLLQGIKGGVE